ncbi:MAG: hypothetical protein J6U98_08375 [Abditibacteriota bacterium]|nr:hypothetical protein [Abditibacteriota bacterium]MBP5092531.1 hypothetical protein [Abditibacteriota bacterium]MBP5718260.1 hypothetical protein [Abditibacteriota bacterium]MBP5738620.1 hypothetical protein [Abditibacteriota bacterium]
MRKNIRKEDDDIQELLNRAKRIDSDNARQKKVNEAVAKFRAKYGEESESAKVAKEGFSIFRKKKREELNINIDDDEEDVYEEVAEKKDEFVEGVSEGSVSPSSNPDVMPEDYEGDKFFSRRKKRLDDNTVRSSLFTTLKWRVGDFFDRYKFLGVKYVRILGIIIGGAIILYFFAWLPGKKAYDMKKTRDAYKVINGVFSGEMKDEFPGTYDFTQISPRISNINVNMNSHRLTLEISLDNWMSMPQSDRGDLVYFTYGMWKSFCEKRKIRPETTSMIIKNEHGVVMSEAYYGGGNIEKDDIVIKKSGLDPEKYFEKLHEEHTK